MSAAQEDATASLSHQYAPADPGLLSNRVAALQPDIRAGLLHNADVRHAQGREPGVASGWGFAARLPQVEQLLEPATHTRDSSEYLSALHNSRTFNCPDCVDAMAEAYGVLSAVTHLRGSVVLHQLSTKHQDDTDDQQQLIKAQIRVGWSAEAVKQGVTLAKKGEYDSAIGCYKKALDLNRRNVDAWVARGAAYANQHAFPRAISDLQTALEIEPGHANASKYLHATEQHMLQLGIPLEGAVPSSRQLGNDPCASLRAPAHSQSLPAAASVSLAHPSQQPGLRTVPAESAAAAGIAGPSGHQAAAHPAHQDEADNQYSESGSGTESPQEAMDLQQALKIVSKHYVARNTSCLPLPCQACHATLAMPRLPCNCLFWPKQKNKSKHKSRKRKRSHSHRSPSSNDRHKAARRRSAEGSGVVGE